MISKVEISGFSGSLDSDFLGRECSDRLFFFDENSCILTAVFEEFIQHGLSSEKSSLEKNAPIIPALAGFSERVRA